MEQVIVQKASGDLEPFAPQKLSDFLHRVQVPAHDVDSIVNTVRAQVHNHISTKEIAHLVTQLLKSLPGGPKLAARYNLKPDIRKLGPDGHNFERYVGKLFAAKGLMVTVAAIVQGKCVNHEVDVVARKQDEFNIVECKFHNREGIRSEVTIAMYVYARFLDIHNAHAQDGHHDFGWLATNTKLTSEALKYADCVGMKVLSVEQPHGESIMDQVIAHDLFPISSIDAVGPYVNELAMGGVVLAHELLNLDSNLAQKIGIPATVLDAAQAEVHTIFTTA